MKHPDHYDQSENVPPTDTEIQVIQNDVKTDPPHISPLVSKLVKILVFVTPLVAVIATVQLQHRAFALRLGDGVFSYLGLLANELSFLTFGLAVADGIIRGYTQRRFTYTGFLVMCAVMAMNTATGASVADFSVVDGVKYGGYLLDDSHGYVKFWYEHVLFITIVLSPALVVLWSGLEGEKLARIESESFEIWRRIAFDRNNRIKRRASLKSGQIQARAASAATMVAPTNDLRTAKIMRQQILLRSLTKGYRDTARGNADDMLTTVSNRMKKDIDERLRLPTIFIDDEDRVVVDDGTKTRPTVAQVTGSADLNGNGIPDRLERGFIPQKIVVPSGYGRKYPAVRIPKPSANGSNGHHAPAKEATATAQSVTETLEKLAQRVDQDELPAFLYERIGMAKNDLASALRLQQPHANRLAELIENGTVPSAVIAEIGHSRDELIAVLRGADFLG